MIAQMREAFLSAAERLEVEIMEVDGEADHVHLLVAYPP
ncbi:putative transposase, partial [Erwinia tracheiphila PSU-1]